MKATEIQGMYSSFDEIMSELRARKQDSGLRKRVADFLGAHGFPYSVEDAPRAFFSRSVMTPNFEMAYFLDLARDLGLRPLLLEYPDKFVAKNPTKYHLTNIHFHEDARRFALAPGVKIGDISAMEGKRMRDAKTHKGESLLDFHHRLLFKAYPELEGSVVDFYDWFNLTRGKGADYYLCYLALFVCDGVLFENFLQGDREETAFVLEKILPSFNRACEIFGVRPLVFPLLPIEYERQNDWLAYPNPIKEHIHGL